MARPALHDMLVRLYALPDVAGAVRRIASRGIAIRRPETWERDVLVAWVREQFTPGWAGECEAAFARHPPACFIAIRDAKLVGFACHDCTRPNFFGPAGVDAASRGQGVGRALTLAALGAMRDAGYAYAIIGGVGPAAFYAKVAGAVRIRGSSPGIYDMTLVSRGRKGV